MQRVVGSRLAVVEAILLSLFPLFLFLLAATKHLPLIWLKDAWR